MLDRIFRKDESVEEEIVEKKWKGNVYRVAKQLYEGDLAVVYPRMNSKGRRPFWFKVERKTVRGGEINLVGRIPGPQQTKRKSIAGNTKVHPVEK